MNEKRCYGCMKIKETDGICPFCGYDESIPNESHQLPAGTVLQEQYLIGKVLGQGGFGITYMGWDLYLSIPVAIKEYFPNGSVMRNCKETTDVISYSGEVGVRFRNNKERFMREVKMLARFSNIPEIVQVKTFFLANNTAYIVMEYVEGITLKEYVKGCGGKLEAEKALKLLRPVMEALSRVHKSGLVHRDISPDNIMIQTNGAVKLLDFGAVRDVGEAVPGKALTKSTEAILKQGYAPIEQYQGHGSLGPWTDVYAFCATIYYCLTGEVPADAPERILGDDIVGFAEQGIPVSPHVEKTIMKGMALRIEDRISDMEQLCRELFEAPEEEDEEVIDSEDVEEEIVDSVDTILQDVVQPDEEAVTVLDEEAVAVLDAEESDDASEADVPAVDVPEAETQEEDIEKADASEDTVQEAVQEKAKTSNITKIGISIAAVLCVFALGLFFWGNSRQNAAQQEAAERTPNTSPATVFEEKIVEGQCGDNVTYTLNITTGEMVLSGTGATWGFRAEEPWIGADEEQPYDRDVPWAENRSQIRTLKIEPGVTGILDHAFIDCENLISVDWGAVEHIEASTFRNTGLQEVVLPDSVCYVADYAFADNPDLTRVHIGKNVEEIRHAAFAGDPLESVTLNDKAILEEREVNGVMMTPLFEVRNIPENLMIYGNTGGTGESFANKYHIPFMSRGFAEGYTIGGQCGDEVYWELDLNAGRIVLSGSGRTWDYTGGMNPEDNPDAVVGWPEWYVYRNYIRELVVEPGIIRIGHCLFNLCQNLNTVDFGAVEEFGVCSFAESGLTHVVLPESTRIVADYAFVGAAIEEITFPENVEEVYGAFTWCENLRSFTVLGKNTRFFYYPGDHGIFMEYDEDPNGKPENVIVYGMSGSDAEIIAQEEEIPFVALDEE